MPQDKLSNLYLPIHTRESANVHLAQGREQYFKTLAQIPAYSIFISQIFQKIFENAETIDDNLYKMHIYNPVRYIFPYCQIETHSLYK